MKNGDGKAGLLLTHVHLGFRPCALSASRSFVCSRNSFPPTAMLFVHFLSREYRPAFTESSIHFHLSESKYNLPVPIFPPIYIDLFVPSPPVHQMIPSCPPSRAAQAKRAGRKGIGFLTVSTWGYPIGSSIKSQTKT
jgi:hypothetical protein